MLTFLFLHLGLKPGQPAVQSLNFRSYVNNMRTSWKTVATGSFSGHCLWCWAWLWWQMGSNVLSLHSPYHLQKRICVFPMQRKECWVKVALIYLYKHARLYVIVFFAVTLLFSDFSEIPPQRQECKQYWSITDIFIQLIKKKAFKCHLLKRSQRKFRQHIHQFNNITHKYSVRYINNVPFELNTVVWVHRATQTKRRAQRH